MKMMKNDETMEIVINQPSNLGFPSLVGRPGAGFSEKEFPNAPGGAKEGHLGGMSGVFTQAATSW